MGKLFDKKDFGNGVKYYYLFGWMYAKKVRNCFYLLKRKKADQYMADDWYAGWHDWKFELAYEECGYEEPNGKLHISLFGWHSVFTMPWKSKRFPYGDCDAPTWGIQIHDSSLWIMKGGDGNMNGGSKWWSWDIPFFTKVHVRHDVMCNLANWDEPEDLRLVSYDHLQRHSGKDYVPLIENELVKKYYYDYLDSYDNTRIPCTFWVEEREWRPKWLTWTGCFKKVHRYIEIEFKNEVGPDKGSWKGGVLGCSYDLLPGEDPMDCIKRMERERKF